MNNTYNAKDYKHETHRKREYCRNPMLSARKHPIDRGHNDSTYRKFNDFPDGWLYIRRNPITPFAQQKDQTKQRKYNQRCFPIKPHTNGLPLTYSD
ncbi:MAG: hypothetical protein II226_00600 [Alistipes sp.]|nr:hypothetical protein [Alistipes sp.]